MDHAIEVEILEYPVLRTLNPLKCYSKPLNKEIVVPKNFVSDGATIPAPFQSFIMPWGKNIKASIIHDYMCRDKKYPRKACDITYLDNMKDLEYSPLKTYIIYYSLQLTAWWWWHTGPSKRVSYWDHIVNGNDSH